MRLCVSSGGTVVSEREWPALFAELPIAALRVEPRVVDELAEVGIDRVGQLLDVPRDEIAARFGGDVLLRIDQASGCAMETLRPVRHEEPPRVALRFAGPTTQFEAIEQAARRLVEKLAARLLKREAGARRLTLEVERLNQDLRPEFAVETLTLSRPSRDARHLWALLRPRIERLHLGEGVEQLSLVASRTAPLPHEQERLDGSADESGATAGARLRQSAGQLVDLLQSRLGSSAVLACEPVETHVPEACSRLLPASERGFWSADGAPRANPSAASPRDAGVTSRKRSAPAWLTPASRGDAAEQTPPDRPTVLLEAPEPAQVTLLQPEGPVIALQWRRLHRITRAIGPERIGRRWWHFALSPRRPPARDYYKLRDDQGLWLWAYRSRATRHWFVHGAWT